MQLGKHSAIAFRCRARDLLGNEEPYLTSPAALTKIDAQGPYTSMHPPLLLEAGDTPQSTTFLMQWEGKDHLSGIASYAVYVRDEAEEGWLTWLDGVTATEALFVGTAGHSYHFCVRGIDRVGNVEDKACPGEAGAWPIVGEALVQTPPASRVEDLPPFLNISTRPAFDLQQYSNRSLREFKEEMEREFIVLRLEENGWNISRAAASLGIERTNLHKKIKQHGIRRD